MKKWYKSKTIIFNSSIFIGALMILLDELMVNQEMVKSIFGEYGLIIIVIVTIANKILRLITKEPIIARVKKTRSS